MMHDLHNDIYVLPGFAPAVVTDDTAQVTAIIDRANFNQLEFVLSTGTLSDSNCTSTVLVEEGDNSALSDAAAVADADLLGTEAGAAVTFADDGEARKIGYRGSKRYVRLTVTPSGNSGNIPICCIAILSGAHKGGFTSQG